MNSPPNGQQLRSLATQTALMDAAETLIANNGAHRVTIKDIVREAGQKNESVLQYHFRNIQGLIAAIHQRRNQQIREKRAQMLKKLEGSKSKLTLHDLCELMVYPTFSLAKTDNQFRHYAAAFSHEIVLSEDSALTKVSKSGGGGKSGMKVGDLLRQALPHLDTATYQARMELAVRMCSAAVSNHMRNKRPTKGPAADFFISNLVDALEGLLIAKPSLKTKG